MNQKNIKVLTSLIIISFFIPIFVYGEGGGGDGGGGGDDSSGIDSGAGRAGGVGTPGVGGGFGGGSGTDIDDPGEDTTSVDDSGTSGAEDDGSFDGGQGVTQDVAETTSAEFDRSFNDTFSAELEAQSETDIDDPGEGTVSIDETDNNPFNDSISAMDRPGYAQAQTEKEDWDNSVLGKISSFFGVEKSLSINPETGRVGLETTVSVSVAGVITGIALGPIGLLAGPAVSALDRSLGVSVVDVSLNDSANPNGNGGSGVGDPFGSNPAEVRDGGDSGELKGRFLRNTIPIPQIIFTANKNVITPGDPVSLSWEVKNADRCEAEGGTAKWLGSLGVSGEFVVDNLKITKVFSVRCFGSGGERRKSLVVSTFNSGDSKDSVDQPINKRKNDNKKLSDRSVSPLLTLAVSPDIVEYGGRSKITWSSKGATFCTAHDDWPLPQFPLRDGKYYKSTSGEQVIYPIVDDMSITLICFNERKLFTKKTVNITVIAP